MREGIKPPDLAGLAPSIVIHPFEKRGGSNRRSFIRLSYDIYLTPFSLDINLYM